MKTYNKPYEIQKLSYTYRKHLYEHGDHKRFIIWTSCGYIGDHLEELKNERLLKHFTGKVIIDELFLTGNDERRFISCPVNHGELNLSHATLLKTTLTPFSKLTTKFLNEHDELIENNTFLTQQEKQMIRNGYGI